MKMLPVSKKSQVKNAPNENYKMYVIGYKDNLQFVVL